MMMETKDDDGTHGGGSSIRGTTVVERVRFVAEVAVVLQQRLATIVAMR